jgi:arsenate reductase
MAEAILNQLAAGRLRGLSAGSMPTGEVHPIALTCLQHNRTPVDHPRSKSWDEFADQQIDLVITVCDNAAGETCPVFPGNPAKFHWGLRDPANAKGSPAEIFAEFQRTYAQLHELLSKLTNALDKHADHPNADWIKQINFQGLLERQSG